MNGVHLEAKHLCAGYCVGFDTLGFQIQQIFKSSCTRFQEPCPIGFASWNSTACCYKLKVNQQLKSDNVKSHKNATWISVSAFVAFVSGLLLTVLHLQENQNETDTFPPFLSDTGEETDISWTAYNTTGFDKESFDKVIKDFHLTSVEDLFKQNHIDCVATFLRLDSDKLQQLGLDIGQQEKCKNAIERISHAANKRQSHQKGNSLTNMSISETSESREPSVRSIPLATKKRINILLKEHTFIPRKTF
ncbi:uncharacterized protein LOC133186213 [Saccostrea echinata]|uniref:uncharacterized protein LOC133186213 n=1 Tax=Saccostrea echinata TaxID=191078 RepID=UPI002A7EB4AF|nr:uncharacterized protein LOC133186213 [Saccostrea echinata]